MVEGDDIAAGRRQYAAARLEVILRHEIPLTRAMGVRVVAWDGECLWLEAPLDPNINHKHTAFGGSLYSLAVLAGWGMVHLLLEESGLRGQIVVADSQVTYRRPVQNALCAVSCRPPAGQLSALVESIRRKGRGRIAMSSRIDENGRSAVDVAATYVVLHAEPR